MNAKSRHPPERRVAICIDTEGFGRKIFEGIMDHARSAGLWRVHTPLHVGTFPLEDPADWVGDGMITDRTEAANADFLRSRPYPVVVTRMAHGRHGLPAVWPDDAMIGEVAAKHLLSLGLREFGLVEGLPAGRRFRRLDAFLHTVRERGGRVSILSGVGPRYLQELPAWREGKARLLDWLRRLSRPCGIYCLSDSEAAEVLIACRELGIPVPEEIAVLGTNNEDLICPMTTPPLSSVDWPARDVGRRAARLLDALMDGATPPSEPVLLPTPGVVARRSTELAAARDPGIQRAIAHLRGHIAHHPLTVGDLAAVAHMSLRTFSRKFPEEMGCPPGEEIQRLRLRILREKLHGTDLPLSHIAEDMGFASQTELSRFFRRHTGQSPSQYRRALLFDRKP